MPLVGTGPEYQEHIDRVQANHEDMVQKSESAYNFVVSTLNDIKDTFVNPDYSVSWGAIQGSVPATWGAEWSAPTAPAVGIVSGSAVPAVGTLTAPSVMTTATAPTWSATLPDQPGDAPTVTAITVPELAELVLPSFTPTLPSPTDLASLVAAFDFTDASYAGRMNTLVQSRLTTVLGGEPVIGADTFQQMYDEAAADLAATYSQAVQGIAHECGMLGELPGVALASRLTLAGSEYRKGRAKVALNMRVEQAKAWREDMWKGIDGAIAFEKLWADIHIAELGRRLQAATAAVQMKVAIHNQQVAWFNGQVALAQAQVQVSAEERARILVTLEDHKERLAHRASDLALAETLVKVWLGEWDGYAKAAAAEATVFSEKVKVFSAAVQQNQYAFASGSDIAKFALEKEGVVTQRFASEWQALAQHAAAVQALTSANATPAEIQIRSESGRMEADLRQLQLAIQNAQLNLEKGKADASLYMDQVRFYNGVRTHALDTILNTWASIMSGYVSAGQTHMGATVQLDATVNNSGTPCSCP